MDFLYRKQNTAEIDGRFYVKQMVVSDAVKNKADICLLYKGVIRIPVMYKAEDIKRGGSVLNPPLKLAGYWIAEKNGRNTFLSTDGTPTAGMHGIHITTYEELAESFCKEVAGTISIWINNNKDSVKPESPCTCAIKEEAQKMFHSGCRSVWKKSLTAIWNRMWKTAFLNLTASAI